MDPWKEAISCYEDFADEVIVLGNNFKTEFMFSDFAPMFEDGFNRSTGDWVIKLDIDTIFHEKDLKKLRSLLEKYNEFPAISLKKYQFFTPERYHMKSRMSMVINKRKYKDVRFNGGGDLCDPVVNGVHITEKNVPRANIAYWNYDCLFKTKDVISNDRARFARAWERTFGDFGDRGGPTPELAYSAWLNMIEERYKKHIFTVKINDHPKYIQEKLQNINNNQFGFDLFGLDSSINRSFRDYFEAYNERYVSEIRLFFKSLIYKEKLI